MKSKLKVGSMSSRVEFAYSGCPHLNSHPHALTLTLTLTHTYAHALTLTHALTPTLARTHTCPFVIKNDWRGGDRIKIKCVI